MADPAAPPNVRIDRSGAIATLTLDRPRALNALDADTLREVARALRDLRRAGDVRALIITGVGGKAFSAGADIAAMAAMSPGDGHAYSELGHEVFARLEALPFPVLAAVNGVALGGGLELALACDLIVAADGARFGQPEINLGLIPGFGGTQRLVLRVGVARARDLIYFGHAIAADEAHRIGLVDRVVRADGLTAEALRLAEELAAKPPVALRQAKQVTAMAAAALLPAGCRLEIEAFAVAFATADRVEGLNAFREKRPPAWKGR